MAITTVGSVGTKAKTPYVSPGLTRNAAGAVVKRPLTPAVTPKAGQPLGNTGAPKAAAALSLPAASAKGAMEQARGTPGYQAAKENYLNVIRNETRMARNPTVTQTPAPSAPITPTSEAPATPIEATPESDPFKSVYEFALKDFQNSPLYKFQQEELNRELDKRLAAQGQLNSGAELEASQRGQQSLGAEWTDRILNMAGTDASRYDQQQTQAADAKAKTQADRRNSATDILRMLLEQNPFSQSVAGLGDFNALLEKMAALNAGTVRDDFATVSPKITSAGGGGGSAPVKPVANPGPDFTGLDLASSLAGQSNSNSFLNLAQNILSGLF